MMVVGWSYDDVHVWWVIEEVNGGIVRVALRTTMVSVMVSVLLYNSIYLPLTILVELISWE